MVHGVGATSVAALEVLRSSVLIPPFDVEAPAGGGVGRGVLSVAALPSAFRGASPGRSMVVAVSGGGFAACDGEGAALRYRGVDGSMLKKLVKNRVQRAPADPADEVCLDMSSMESSIVRLSSRRAPPPSDVGEESKVGVPVGGMAEGGVMVAAPDPAGCRVDEARRRRIARSMPRNKRAPPKAA